jgi:DNA-directed RNA polymerase subunit RPC12/RpoP
MPSYSHRNETDIRASRFESEVRVPELNEIGIKAKQGIRTRLYQCSKCLKMFEERSITCPRCNTHTMGELRHI